MTSEPKTTPSDENDEKGERPFEVGSFVILRYDEGFYPAKIVHDDPGKHEFYCCAMTNSGKNWKWSDPPDLLWYHEEDIVIKIKEPEAINARGVYSVPEILAFI